MIKNIPVPIFKTIQRYRQDQGQTRMPWLRQTLRSCDPCSADFAAEFLFTGESDDGEAG